MGPVERTTYFAPPTVFAAPLGREEPVMSWKM
jgi:hypothetical protein